MLKDAIKSYNFELVSPQKYSYKNGKLYSISANGTRNKYMSCVRNVGQYKLFAAHFDVALPQSNYAIVDTENGNIYMARGLISYFSPLKNIIDLLTLPEQIGVKTQLPDDYDPLAD